METLKDLEIALDALLAVAAAAGAVELVAVKAVPETTPDAVEATEGAILETPEVAAAAMEGAAVLIQRRSV